MQCCNVHEALYLKKSWSLVEALGRCQCGQKVKMVIKRFDHCSDEQCGPWVSCSVSRQTKLYVICWDLKHIWNIYKDIKLYCYRWSIYTVLKEKEKENCLLYYVFYIIFYIKILCLINAIPDHQNLYDMSTESESPLITDVLVVLHSQVKHQWKAFS